MADIKISSATNAGIVLGTDKIPIARSGSAAAYFATASEIKSYTGGGGGGGSYTAGNGLYFSGTSPTTIGNTGTIIQQAGTGGAAPGILLQSGVPDPAIGTVEDVRLTGAYISQPGTAAIIRAGRVRAAGGAVYLTDLAGHAYAGDMVATGGYVYNDGGGVGAFGALFIAKGGQVNGVSLSQGGAGSMIGGIGYGATTNNGGDFTASGGYGSTQGGNLNLNGGAAKPRGAGLSPGIGGNVILTPGAADVGGGGRYGVVVLAAPMPTVDPHNLGAVFQSATANLLGNYSLYRSQG